MGRKLIPNACMIPFCGLAYIEKPELTCRPTILLIIRPVSVCSVDTFSQFDGGQLYNWLIVSKLYAGV